MTAENRAPARRGLGRVAFHALQETVKAEIDAGYTVRMIYDRHREAIPVSYEQFRAYIARDITGTAGSRGGRVNRRNVRPSAPRSHGEQPTSADADNGRRAVEDDTAPPPIFTPWPGMP